MWTLFNDIVNCDNWMVDFVRSWSKWTINIITRLFCCVPRKIESVTVINFRFVLRLGINKWLANFGFLFEFTWIWTLFNQVNSLFDHLQQLFVLSAFLRMDLCFDTLKRYRYGQVSIEVFSTPHNQKMTHRRSCSLWIAWHVHLTKDLFQPEMMRYYWNRKFE